LIIAVNNNKGGVLKTTTVTNLAGVLARQKKKVLIIDADNQSNVSLSFGLNPDNFKTTLYDVLVGGVPAEYSIVQINKYIDLLPSNLEMINFEFDVIGDAEHYPNRFELLKNAVNHLRDSYDYIFIDTPPSLSLVNFNVFVLADFVLIPYEPEAYAMRSLLAVHQMVNQFKELNPDLEIIGVLFTKVVWNSNLHVIIKQETKKFAVENGFDVFETEIPRTVEYANEVGFNRKPAIFNPRSDKGKLYKELWDKEILPRLKERNVVK
jgi:chromosome partitioning protein